MPVMRKRTEPDLSGLTAAQLEERADSLMGLGRRRGNRDSSEYPILTERQLAKRRAQEVPMHGDLLEWKTACQYAQS